MTSGPSVCTARRLVAGCRWKERSRRAAGVVSDMGTPFGVRGSLGEPTIVSDGPPSVNRRCAYDGTNSPRARMTMDPLIISLVSACTALFASIVGPLVTLTVARRQFNATVLSGNRQKWIEALRETL